LRHVVFLSLLLAAVALPAAAPAAPELPEIPNLGQSGHDVALPDVVGDHYPPDLPAGPPPSSFASSEIPAPPETPAGPPDGVPPDPETPAHGEHPLGGAPPFGLGKPAVVPEPAAFALLAAGLGGLLVSGRRRP
jgi:hypothetical protein